MQIGPKLHVGGTLGKIGQKAKIGLGKLEQQVAPFIAMIPGVGPIASAGLAANGRILDTSHGSVGFGDIAKAGIKGGVGGLVAGGAGKVLGHIPGISSLASHLPGVGGLFGGGSGGAAVGGGLNDVANAGISSVGSGAMGAAGSAAGAAGGSGIMGSIGSFLGSHGTQLLEGAQGINTALQQKKANDLANRALGSAEGAYNDRAPLRQAGIAGMLQPKVPSIASLNQSGPNPYAKPQAPGIVPAGY